MNRITKRIKEAMLTIAAVSAMATVVSCNRDADGLFEEGTHQPEQKVATVRENGALAQSWDWGEKKLSTITDQQNGCTYTFSYAGDKLANTVVSYKDGSMESIFYSYENGYLTKVELVNGNRVDMEFQVSHNANDKFSTININISDIYFFEMAMAALNGNIMIKSQGARLLLGDDVFDNLVKVAAVAPQSNRKGAKYSIENKHFQLTYAWDGDNVREEVLSGNVAATATLSDMGQFIDLGPLQFFLDYLDMDIEYPISVTVNRKVTYTYDEKFNPYWYCWIAGFDARSLSRNNILTDVAVGSGEGTVTVSLPNEVPMVGGMEYPLSRTVDMSHDYSYTYEYNRKKYPVTVTNQQGARVEFEYKK